MLEFPNQGRLVQDTSELPWPDEIDTLYLDVETTSKDPKKTALNPWRDCWVAGISFTYDDHPGSWYIPVSHHAAHWNLPRDKVFQWLKHVISVSKVWVNHNVKFDCHVLFNDFGIDPLSMDLVCTVVRAKILDSDRVFKGGYGLDALSEAWLNENIKPLEIALQPYLDKNKDYGRIPADILGHYACQDVVTNRRLYGYLNSEMPGESKPVVDTETDLTSLLVRMERRGVLVKPDELAIRKLYCLTDMVAIEQRLQELVGYRFLPTSPDACFDVLCNRFGLPVLGWTDEGNPSFDKHALAKYRSRVDAPKEVVELIFKYRELSNLKGLFIEAFEELSVPRSDGYAVLHPDHNQCVRTGRMSARQPNSQQLNEEAKSLIHPGDGMSFLSSDASQIEFRTIAHYTQDPDVLEAYNRDPDVDYHMLVANMCKIKRRPAKTVNFAVAFGQGKKSTVALLSADEDVVSSLFDAVDQMILRGELHPDGKDAAFQSLARMRGEAVYDTYHETFPYIKATAKQAAYMCRSRGYVRNVRGRYRRLPTEHAHKAFNSLNQSSAADIVKDRMVTLDREVLRGTAIELVLQVHDEVVLVGPTEAFEDPRTCRDIVACLEDVQCLRVPVRFKYGVSSENWMKASKSPKDGGVGDISLPLEERANGQKLRHLKSAE